MASKLKLRTIFFVIFCLPGLLIVGYAAQQVATGLALRGSGLTGSGTIVAYERQENQHRVGRRFCPIVEFAHAGIGYRFTEKWCSTSPKDVPAGSAVDVVFEAGNPAKACIRGIGPLYGKGLFIGAIGTPWLLLGIALVFRVR